MKVEKCKSKENMDTCVPMSTMKTRQYCRLLLNNKANEAWSSFFSCIRPVYQCPMKKGTYIGTNCTYNMDMFQLFPLGGYFWKFHVEVNHPKTNNLVMCFDMDFSTTTKY
ncbi:PREDICTED: uncharacterized protein LOC108562165 [Nicrophorus vespilloides]|uniref:Uncharacterized protein LOC108562165 n=1 Tax=Nicrophorus vespilloides TaxID=110193 RepID=A0ABM1MMT6_NICVS|nr:PREDICTED: uncharacterized protein LOC108562165 [Nicrophorus vespilloides]